MNNKIKQYFIFMILCYFGFQENSEIKEIKEELSAQEEERLLSKTIISQYLGIISYMQH